MPRHPTSLVIFYEKPLKLVDFYLVRDAVLSITNIRSRSYDRYHKSKKEARKTASALHV